MNWTVCCRYNPVPISITIEISSHTIACDQEIIDKKYHYGWTLVVLVVYERIDCDILVRDRFHCLYTPWEPRTSKERQIVNFSRDSRAQQADSVSSDPVEGPPVLCRLWASFTAVLMVKDDLQHRINFEQDFKLASSSQRAMRPWPGIYESMYLTLVWISTYLIRGRRTQDDHELYAVEVRFEKCEFYYSGFVQTQYAHRFTLTRASQLLD